MKREWFKYYLKGSVIAIFWALVYVSVTAYIGHPSVLWNFGSIVAMLFMVDWLVPKPKRQPRTPNYPPNEPPQ